MKANWIMQAVLITIINLVMLPAQPDTLWTRTYGGASTDIARCVQTTSDGGYILTGSTASYGTGDMDVYIIKTDSLGDTLWTRVYGGPYAAISEWVECTADNGYIIAATIGYSDVWLIKIDMFGDTLWTSIFGGANGEGSWSVKQTRDGGYVVCGKTESYGAGWSDVWVIKTDAVGDSIWTKTYGSTNNDLGRSVVQTVDGGYVIAGYTYSYSAGQSDVWLIKTDSLGDTLWTRSYGGVDYDYAYQVVETQDHGYFITGMTQSFGNGGADAWFIKTDSLGDTLWTKCWGESQDEFGMSGIQTTDGGYAVMMSIPSFAGDVCLMKLDSLGNVLWTKQVGDATIEICYSLVQTADGGYISAGDKERSGTGVTDAWLIRFGPETVIAEDFCGSAAAMRDYITIAPDPFMHHTKITWQSSWSGLVPTRLKIFNAAGALVRQFSCPFIGGTNANTIIWNGADEQGSLVSPGVYFFKLMSEDDNIVVTQKGIIMRQDFY